MELSTLLNSWTVQGAHAAISKYLTKRNVETVYFNKWDLPISVSKSFIWISAIILLEVELCESEASTRPGYKYSSICMCCDESRCSVDKYY